ncbi:MAG: hypothetical protein GC153_02195 [Alphaproteobacteria bacterium]|nr:hypothetical protein [Alphaproteobacteria bacterium]
MADVNAEARAHYEAHGYAHLKGVASPEVAKNLLGLFHHHLTTKPDALQKNLSKPGVNVLPAFEIYGYRFAPLLGFHWGLTSRVCEATGKRLAPTYAFFRVYPKGDRCTVHSDRPACEHSMSMPLAYADNIIWNFEIGKNHYDFDAALNLGKADDFGGEEFTSLKLAPGDAILYSGPHRRHGRISPNPNAWSAHLFLHWVDLDGPWSEWAFDRQVLPQAGAFSFPAKAPA